MGSMNEFQEKMPDLSAYKDRLKNPLHDFLQDEQSVHNMSKLYEEHKLRNPNKTPLDELEALNALSQNSGEYGDRKYNQSPGKFSLRRNA
jgi:hypothetical protein